MSPLNRHRLLFVVALGLTLGSGAALRKIETTKTSDHSRQTTDGTVKPRVVENYGKLPLSFEVNLGQSSDEVKFLTRGPGYSLFLTAREAVLSVSSKESEDEQGDGRNRASSLRNVLRREPEEKKNNADVLRMALLGASQNAEPEGLDELPGKTNYFIGDNPSKWRSNISTYGKVLYKNIYPGVDLVYYGNHGQLEYDFVLAAGADPRQIALSFAGSTKAQRRVTLRMDKAGDILAKSGSSVVRLKKPIIYQPNSSSTNTNSKFVATNVKPVDGRFVLTASNQVRFELGSYDKSQPLIIDPVLTYSTFLGFQGSGTSMAVDSSGNLFITGATNQPNFPTTPGAFNTTGGVAYVAKVNATGSALLYCTYFGGTTNSGIAGEGGPFLAVDSLDNVYLTGNTTATDFPVSSNAFQTKLGNAQGSNAFASKLDPTGSKLLYSTYLGGSNGIDTGYGIGVDSSGAAYVVGVANSTDFPTTTGAFQTLNNGGAGPGISGDGFVTEVKPDGTGLIFSTFLGGTGGDFATSVVIDGTGAIYVAGGTTSTDFPTKNPYQSALNGTGWNGFLTKFAPGGSTLDYSTYFGPGGYNQGATVVGVDPLGEAYVSGGAVYAKFNAAGSALLYSAPALSVGSGFAVDASENMYVVADTNTAGLPVASAIQDTYNGGNDCYLAAVNLKTAALVFGSYLGGSEREFGCFATLDSTGHLYVTGWTASVNFPLLAGGLSSSFVCCTNAFLTKVDLSAAATPAASVTPTNLTFQGSTGGTQTVTLKNTGTTALNISQVGFQVPSKSFSETDTCTGSTIAVGASCSVDVTFTPQTAESDPALLSITYGGTGRPTLVVLTVVDFSFTPSANSLTLKAGTSGSFSLLVLPLGGYVGNASIQCSGAPSLATCTPSPNSVAFDGLHGGTVTVNVSAAAATTGCGAAAATAGWLGPAGPPPFTLASIAMLPIGFVAFCLASIRPLPRARHRLQFLALLLVSMLFLPSCGGSSTPTGCSGGAGSPGTPSGTYTLTVTGTSGKLSHSTSVSLTVN